MKKEYLTILTNIIGGVESGGQTYGKRKYGAYAGKAANADNEKTCTLGWAQNYGNEGRRLCQMILKADPKAFRTADTAGIEKKLSVDWEATRWNPTGADDVVRSRTSWWFETSKTNFCESEKAIYT